VQLETEFSEDGPGFSRSLAEREELQPVVTGSASTPWGPGLCTPAAREGVEEIPSTG